MSDKPMSKEDICTHLGDEYNKHFGAIVPPIFQNTLFTAKNGDHGYTYTRINNPTFELAERKVAALEEGEAALCFSSGMAAISAALMHVLEQNSHVIVPRTVYLPTKHFLEHYMAKFGVTVSFVSGEDIDEIEQAIRPNTKAIYLETPLSNIFSLQDLRATAELAKKRSLTTIVDNTWATPLYQNPIPLGIDLVVHSASKYLGGHSDVIGGMMIGNHSVIEKIRFEERAMYGAVMDPHQAWLLTRGLRTLPVRMAKHQESAMKIAAFLESHSKVERVLYPGLPSHPQYELGRRQMTGYSGLLSFVASGTPEQIQAAVRQLTYFEIGPSWGGFESLLSTPGVGINKEASERTGIPSGLIRISVGQENADTLIDDLDQALRSY